MISPTAEIWGEHVLIDTLAFRNTKGGIQNEEDMWQVWNFRVAAQSSSYSVSFAEHGEKWEPLIHEAGICSVRLCGKNGDRGIQIEFEMPICSGCSKMSNTTDNILESGLTLILFKNRRRLLDWNPGSRVAEPPRYLGISKIEVNRMPRSCPVSREE